MGELKKVFRPEFLNRIDEVIVFHKLTRDEIKEIIDLMIGRVRAQVAEHELQLELDEEARELLVDKGWDPAMGARPLRRAIQRYIEDPLADEVLRTGDIVPGTTVLVERDASGDEDDRPLKMKLVKPRKRPAKKREPVGVGAASSGDAKGSGPDGEPGDDGGSDGAGDGDEPSPAADAQDGEQPSAETE
jgi:ATP-dependent Clp protease ATP-binding subunit ClpC